MEDQKDVQLDMQKGLQQQQQVMQEFEEKAILIAIIAQNKEKEVLSSLEELEELAKTAGATTFLKVTQSREKPHPGTYFGKGKIEELSVTIGQYGITTIICDDELSPAQLKNLSEALDAKVIDRAILIMDIFAKHAHTKEGILQVEMAQMRYRLSRLTGLGTSLSRLGGGIGSRGPGEKKLEMDRRYIRRRIGLLQDELERIHSSRHLLREGRAKLGKPIIAIVGYTNAGKSTLLNYLTNAGVLQVDMLFATLDPTTRNLSLPEGKEVLMVDTVGFIRKLPHHIVEAFKSTLEEVVYADILIHVVDVTNPDARKHIEVVHETLNELGAGDKPMLTLLNKADKEGVDDTIEDSKAFMNIKASAFTGMNIDVLLRALEAKLLDGQVHIKIVIPYSQGQILQVLRVYGHIIEESYTNEGTYVEVYIEESYINKYQLRDMEVENN
jgi:GTP-binding protein HflX